MKNRAWIVYTFVGVFITASLFVLFFTNKVDLSRALGASASFPEIADESQIIKAARKMVQEHINDYEDGEVVVTIKELVKNKYLTGFEVNPATNIVYDENTRIVFNIENGKIEDAYVKNNLFKNVFSCDSVCYLSDDNYIAYDNEVYRILKIDQEGNIYIFNNKTKKVKSSNIDSTLKKLYNDADKNIVQNVVSVSSEDIKNSKIIDVEDNMFVNTNSGYKLYSIGDSNVIDITGETKSNLMPIIVLKDDVTYELGEGTKFSPYVVNE